MGRTWSNNFNIQVTGFPSGYEAVMLLMVAHQHPLEVIMQMVLYLNVTFNPAITVNSKLEI